MKDWIKELYMYILATIIVLAVFILLYFLVFVGIPETNRDILNIVVGAVIGSFVTVVGFFFGSSKGSADKTKIIANGQKDPS